MATLFEYKCKKCGYSTSANPKGKYLLMSGEVIDCPVPKECPECGGKMEKTGVVIELD